MFLVREIVEQDPDVRVEHADGTVETYQGATSTRWAVILPTGDVHASYADMREALAAACDIGRQQRASKQLDQAMENAGWLKTERDGYARIKPKPGDAY